MDKNFAILDVETTGGKFNEEKITEIAIFIYNGEKIIDKFESLINPSKEIQPFVQRLTGINNDLVKDSPKFIDVSKEIFEITKNKIIVAHNVGFDYRVIKNEFQNINIKYIRDTLCTVDLSKLIFPDLKSYKLTNLLSNFGILNENPHRANSDALGTVELFKILNHKDLDMKVIISKIKSNSEDK
ncbi:MAG: PolC-type DNA polymerase III [Flavobacteriaceae bacterium]